MTTDDQEKIERLLKHSLLPTSTKPRATLDRDLWPAMLRRLAQPPAAVPWFDWALLAAVVVCLVLFPRAIPILLYHL